MNANPIVSRIGSLQGLNHPAGGRMCDEKNRFYGHAKEIAGMGAGSVSLNLKVA
jgi:hypothetical protein